MARLARVSHADLEMLLMSRLRKGEHMPPENVLEVCMWLCNHEVGFVISRNDEAQSCKDARDKRNRLGHRGIHLFDELKSLIYAFEKADGSSETIAIHCRADCDLNLGKLSQYLGTSGFFRKLESELLSKTMHLEYGVVNPVLLETRGKTLGIRQIFDSSVTTPVARIPGTMMTNAGDHSWAIEFDPMELLGAIEEGSLASIADPIALVRASESPQMSNPRSIGIITGNGPDSGIALWEAINDRIAEELGGHFLGDISLPRITVISVPEMGLSMELKYRADATWEALEKAVSSLCELQCELIAVACNTTQVFQGQLRQLCAERGAQFVSMADSLIQKINSIGTQEFAIVGIDSVAELGRWSAFAPLADLQVERLKPEVLKEITDIGYLVKQRKGLYRGFQQLVRIFEREISSSVIIVALTEISVILAAQSKKTLAQQTKVIIDTLDVYAEALASISLGKR